MRIDPDSCRDPDLLAAEVRRLRNVLAADDPWLTDAERDAVEVAARFMDKWGGVPNTIASATLRGLLERLGGER